MKGKILLLTHEYPPVGGGASPVVAKIAEAYVLEGYDVEVVTMAIGQKDSVEYFKGIKIVTLAVRRRTLFKASTISLLLFILRSYRYVHNSHTQNKISVIHAHFAIPAGITAWWLKKRTSIPYILSMHGSDVLGYRQSLNFVYRLIGPIWRRVLKDARKVIVPSKYLESWVERALGEKLSTICVIPHGIDAVPTFTDRVREDVVLTSGRLIGLKRIDKIIKAVSLVPKINLVIIGDGGERTNLEKLARLTGVKTFFTGWLSSTGEEYKKYFVRAKYYVAMSERESFGMTVLEALSYGNVVLVAPNTALAEVVGEAGVILKDDSEETLAHTILELQNDQKMVKRYSHLATKRAMEFSWDCILPRYIQLL